MGVAVDDGLVQEEVMKVEMGVMVLTWAEVEVRVVVCEELRVDDAVVVAVLVEVEREVDNEEELEEVDVEDCKEVVVGVAMVLDKLVVLSLLQNGDRVSAPPHVCPWAQQMDPHWKSPEAQTRVQPAAPAPAGQQKKAPLSCSHVSLTPPGCRQNAG